MIWVLFAFFTAFFASLTDVFSKKGISKDIDEYLMSWAFRLFTLLFVLPLLFFIDIPELKSGFWVAMFVGGTLNVCATILFMKAIKYSDLSISIPMIAFTPLFLLVTSPLILGEFPSIYGLIGVIFIVFGSYILNIKEKHKGYLEPFKALLREKGPRYMLIVAFIFSIAANIDKIGLQNSSPFFWIVSINIFFFLALTPIMLLKSRKNFSAIKKNINIFIPLGLFNSLTLIFHMTAISLTLVAYVICIKRTSVIMSVLFGYFIFKEKNIKERMTGVIIMVIGVLFITLS